MKITKQILKRIINEELGRVLNEVDPTNPGAQLDDFTNKLENLYGMKPSSPEVENFLKSLTADYGKDVIATVNLVNKKLASRADSSVMEIDRKAFRDAVVGFSYNLSDEHGMYNPNNPDTNAQPTSEEANNSGREFTKTISPLIYSWRKA